MDRGRLNLLPPARRSAADRALFLLGHCVWGYLLCRLTGQRLQAPIAMPLAFLLGVLADFDLYVQPLGARHHTYSHSLLVLGPVAAGLLLYQHRRGAVVTVGLLSHLLTDALVGSVPLLYPLTAWEVGLHLGIPSAADSLLEVGALLLTLLYMIRNGDGRTLLQRHGPNLRLLVPLLAIASLSLLFAQDNSIDLVTYGFSRRALTAISLGHVVLGAVLGLGVVQGFRGLRALRASYSCIPYSPALAEHRSALRLLRRGIAWRKV